MRCFFLLRLTLVMALLLSPAAGDEKNGLSVMVTKTTLDRSDTRNSYYYADRIDRTQGLKVAIKNVSFKDMPEGEIEWTILVRKYYSTTVLKHSGKEKLKPLARAEATDMVIGSAQILGWRDLSGQSKDKIEYQVVVTQGGKETIRVSSTNSFAALEKRAIVEPSTSK